MILIMPMLTVLSCSADGNLGEDCTSDSDCTEGNACTVISTIDNCEGKTPEKCLEELTAPENFSIFRGVGKCTVVQPLSECDDNLFPCVEGELCVFRGGFSNFECQAKYEQRINGFPCQEDKVCASGSCSTITEAPGYPVGMCVTQVTPAE